MIIEKIHIKGFRNFKDAEIHLQKKSLVIGANDVGKTNLIYALRLLFDKSLSERDLELSESDYYAYSLTSTIEITVWMCEVEEECLLSEFAGSVKDGKLIIRYTNQKGGSYQIFTGFDESILSELSTRKYLRRLNMQYVDTNRNLMAFLGRERVKMLQISKEKLTDEQKNDDQQKIEAIQESLDNINNDIGSLNYIASSLSDVNHELQSLSIHNEGQTVAFVAGDSKAEKLLDNLVLSYSAEESSLAIGGDGRKNQIFLATWMAKQHAEENIDHVTFYAIEEPEAHLHPHQQRKLSSYIQNKLDSQVIVTSHSPHIASRFDPSNLIRLYSENKQSLAASGGCSELLRQVINDFGHRLNVLSAETFFSDGVFLVEGTSEVMLYTALADEIGVDLDRYNISVLSVEGIGFKPYIAVCNALNIPWALRTDNDVFSKTISEHKYEYYSGITRVMGIVKDAGIVDDDLAEYWGINEKNNSWLYGTDIPENSLLLNNDIRNKVGKHGLYMSDKDLESDLANSPIEDCLFDYYKESNKKSLIEKMKERKAERMYDFLCNNRGCLSRLRDSDFITPLDYLVEKVKERTKP